jgi:hypothetical protein
MVKRPYLQNQTWRLLGSIGTLVGIVGRRGRGREETGRSLNAYVPGNKEEHHLSSTSTQLLIIYRKLELHQHPSNTQARHRGLSLGPCVLHPGRPVRACKWPSAPPRSLLYYIIFGEFHHFDFTASVQGNVPRSLA